MGVRIQFNAADQGQTTDNTPLNLGLVEFPNTSTCFVSVQVIAVRSDAASKGWQIVSFIKKNGGTLAVQETRPAPLNPFVSAADTIPMTGVTISLYSDETYIGVVCNGQNGQTIDWIVDITADGWDTTE